VAEAEQLISHPAQVRAGSVHPQAEAELDGQVSPGQVLRGEYGDAPSGDRGEVEIAHRVSSHKPSGG